MTVQPASSRRSAQAMLLASSKRARSSMRTVTSLPASAAAMRLSQRWLLLATR